MNPLKGFVAYPKRAPDAHLRLICLAHAGAGVTPFYKWAAHVDQDIELVAIRLPGRESRIGEFSFTDMTPLLDDLCPVLLKLLDKPYAIVGHCSGALIAFELLRRLQHLAAPEPLCLYVSGRPAPDVKYCDPLLDDLSDEALADAIGLLGGTPPEVLRDPEFLALILPAYRADLVLCARYVFASGVPFQFPIVAMRGEQDRFLGREDMETWRRHTRASFDLRTFPGEHFFIYENPSVAQAISTELLSGGRRENAGTTAAPVGQPNM